MLPSSAASSTPKESTTVWRIRPSVSSPGRRRRALERPASGAVAQRADACADAAPRDLERRASHGPAGRPRPAAARPRAEGRRAPRSRGPGGRRCRPASITVPVTADGVVSSILSAGASRLHALGLGDGRRRLGAIVANPTTRSPRMRQAGLSRARRRAPARRARARASSCRRRARRPRGRDRLGAVAQLHASRPRPASRCSMAPVEHARAGRPAPRAGPPSRGRCAASLSST